MFDLKRSKVKYATDALVKIAVTQLSRGTISSLFPLNNILDG